MSENGASSKMGILVLWRRVGDSQGLLSSLS